MPKNIRLLVITNNLNRASFRQRVGAYLDALAAQGVATEVALLPKGFLARRRLFHRATDFDGVFLHKKKLNRHDAWCLRHHSRKIIYNFDDAIMYDCAQPERRSNAHYVPFRRTVQLADLVIVGSAYLAERATPFNSNVHILPLGLNIQEYGVDPPPPRDDRVRLVWIGSRETLAYLDLIEPALKRVAARFHKMVVRVIGDTFPAWQGIPVEEIKWSVQARRSQLATSDIGLAPLPDNPFTQGKCSFKVLEYSASGLPVVASPIGTNAEYVREGVTGFLAEGVDQWVDSIARLIENAPLREAMGRAGRQYAAEFDVAVIGAKLCELITGFLRDQDR